MEETIKVNAVEDNTPAPTTQEKEAAVLEQAIENATGFSLMEYTKLI